MDKMPPSSPEYTVLRNYADWIIDLPWREATEDTEQLSDVEKVLNADHYGLEKIKERVVEYLAVLKLTGELKAWAASRTRRRSADTAAPISAQCRGASSMR